ncbi:hypothetical protein FQA39_LY07354 [Lamprigera yunnana]|nr:hypothetical protein FQA39_LY07354 [Lamprigera yunnana]
MSLLPKKLSSAQNLKRKRTKQDETEKPVKLLSKFLRVEKSSESSSSELAQHQNAKKQDLFKRSSSCETHEDEEKHIQEYLGIPGTSSGFQKILWKKLCQMNSIQNQGKTWLKVTTVPL